MHFALSTRYPYDRPHRRSHLRIRPTRPWRRLRRRTDRCPAGYVRTGETEHCLQTRRIDSLRILNKTQILVEMNNGERYLQQPRSCSPLRKQYAFAYEAFGGELCDTTQVTLHDTGLDFGVTGVCIFDKFEKLEKQSAAN